MDDKQSMQADGKGTGRKDAEENDETAGHLKSEGESDGGAYPDPHTGKKPGGFDGGQSGRAYHGTGQLGDQKTGDENSNAPSTT